MMTDEERAAVADAVNNAAAIAIAAAAVIRELVVDVARQQPDPQSYAKALFDRASGHFDARDDLATMKPAIGLGRDLLGAWFRDAAAALAAPPAAGPRGGATRRR